MREGLSEEKGKVKGGGRVKGGGKRGKVKGRKRGRFKMVGKRVKLNIFKPFSEGDYYVVILSGGNPTI